MPYLSKRRLLLGNNCTQNMQSLIHLPSIYTLAHIEEGNNLNVPMAEKFCRVSLYINKQVLFDVY